jgi:hypothetical protein
LNYEHKEQTQQTFQTAEIQSVDAATQTITPDIPIEPYVEKAIYDHTPVTFETVPQPQQYRSQIVRPIIQQYIPPPIPPFERTPTPHPYIPPVHLPEPPQRTPRFNIPPGLCLVPCPETIKYAHLPPHRRPELFCVELPPPSDLPPPPPPLPPPPPMPRQPCAQGHRYCIRCCCVPGRSLIKKIVYREIQG